MDGNDPLAHPDGRVSCLALAVPLVALSVPAFPLRVLPCFASL
jgi:hypothetical protein